MSLSETSLGYILSSRIEKIPREMGKRGRRDGRCGGGGGRGIGGRKVRTGISFHIKIELLKSRLHKAVFLFPHSTTSVYVHKHIMHTFLGWGRRGRELLEAAQYPN